MSKVMANLGIMVRARNASIAPGEKAYDQSFINMQLDSLYMKTLYAQ